MFSLFRSFYTVPVSASKITDIVLGGDLNSTHSVTVVTNHYGILIQS